MLLKTIYVRFYKSFNFDYLRKSHPKSEPQPWEQTAKDHWYPYVRVPVEPGITTVVGANESGKSQLLSAIKCVLTGEGIDPADFCRYSQFFAIDDELPLPDFGAEFDSLSEADRAAVAAACGLDTPRDFEAFLLFRLGDGTDTVYLRTEGGLSRESLTDKSVLEAVLPRAFEIDAQVPLPESVPVSYLATGALPLDRTRSERRRMWGSLLDNLNWFASQDTVTQQAAAIADFFHNREEADEQRERELRLAEDLLIKVAGVNRAAFAQLQQAVARSEEGYANGLVEKINDELTTALNFPKWWSQDRDFRLLVTLRDEDLVFTIRDRTGTEYSFNERSGGLKFFLSYFVQYLAHDPPLGIQEVLLMDEPDAYLSSQGQQDLLRIFDAFAHPEDDRPACQAVYVTHSPFLVDKNHGERIRVLEKGEGDEGTRVVRDAARNHYEPLRSAFGDFVGETTFISNCNLMLEGPSDQIIVAGMSAYLRKNGTPKTENLDLNDITLVPTGSASQAPYMVYLARGRDVERPAVIVLLDSDQAGDHAKSAIAKGPLGKPLLRDELVLQIGQLPADEIKTDNPDGAREIEDLVGSELGLAAAKAYVADYLGQEHAASVAHVTASDLDFQNFPGTLSAIEAALMAVLGDSFHLDKVGFARSVTALMDDRSDDGDVNSEIREAVAANFRLLFRRLAHMQRLATRDYRTEKMGSRIRRAKHSFLLDHPGGATREDANLLLEEIDTVLDKSLDSEELRLEMRRLAERFDLDHDITESVEKYEDFKDALTTLAYQARLDSQDPE